MARLHREHHRMLGNGYCARPKVMDCQFESICESCTFFQTTIEFRPPCSPNAPMSARHSGYAGDPVLVPMTGCTR